MPARGTEIVIIKKNGDFNSSTLPEGGIDDLYKRCSFKKPDGFNLACSWTIPGDTKIFIRVYGKTSGRAGAENKAELPPPVDKVLFFGNIAIVASQGSALNKSKPISLSVQRLHELLDLLSGGSEDLGGSKNDECDALEDAAHEVVLRSELKKRGVKLISEGYAKDGFVVDDIEMIEDVDDVEDATDNDVEEDDEEEEMTEEVEDESESEGHVIEGGNEGDMDAENLFLSGYTQLEGDPDQLGYEDYDSE